MDVKRVAYGPMERCPSEMGKGLPGQIRQDHSLESPDIHRQGQRNYWLTKIELSIAGFKVFTCWSNLIRTPNRLFR